MNATDYYTFTTIQRERTYQILHKGNMIASEQIEYEPIKIIESNNISNILPIQVEEIDQQLCLQYDISNMNSLKEWIQYRGVGMDDFLQLIEGIVETVERAKSSGFHADKFCLHTLDQLFVDSHLHNINLLYIPLKHEHNQQSFQQNIEQLITMLSPYVKDIQSHQMQQVMTALQGPTFEITSFKELLHRLQLSPESVEEKQPSKAKAPASALKPRWSLVTVDSYIGGLLLILAAWGTSVYFESEEGLFGAAILTGALCTLVVLQNMKQRKATVVEEPASFVAPVATPSVNVPPAPVQPVAPVLTTEPTVLLSQDQPKPPVSQSTSIPQTTVELQTAQGQIITVTNDTFTIGRNEDVVDHVVAVLGVSRAHFQVIRLNDHEFGIKDLQSKNGTKLNGVKLEPSKVYKVQEGDKIRFSSEAMTVRLER